MKKKIAILAGLAIIFGAGFLVGFYKLIPINQILAVKHYIEYRTGTFEQQQVRGPEDVMTENSFLKRLLIKKLRLPAHSGHGGGISVNNEILFLSSNKGDVSVIDMQRREKLESSIQTAPLNFGDLIQSGHPYRNEFRLHWFRVNGVYSEKTGANSFSLFLSHNSYDRASDCISHNVSRANIERNGDRFVQQGEWNTIFTAEPCIDPAPDTYLSAVPYSGHISGGAMQNYSDDKLLITVGDYNHHGLAGVPSYAMDPEKPYGKFLLLDKQTGEWSIFAKGTRNPSGLFIDEDSTIWSVENGPEAGDELNIIREGVNYGWPEVSYGIWYDPRYDLSDQHETGRHQEYEKPIYSWVPAIAPSSIIRIEGDKFRHWKGDLIIGTMRGQSLYRVRLDSGNRVAYHEQIPLGHRVRDITVLHDETIAVLTDDGYLIIIDDGGPVFEEKSAETEQRIASLEQYNRIFSSDEIMAARDDAKGIYDQSCATCHSLGTSSGIGPHLNSLYGREIGSLDDFRYSGTLEQDSRKWDAELLESFLKNPDAEFAGNRMQKVSLSEAEIDSLVRFFESLD